MVAGVLLIGWFVSCILPNVVAFVVDYYNFDWLVLVGFVCLTFLFGFVAYG